MKATTIIRTVVTPDGEGLYGVQAVAEITFEQGDGTSIVGTKISSPGLWGIGGYADDSYFESVALEELDVLAEMLTALGMTNVGELMPDTIELVDA